MSCLLLPGPTHRWLCSCRGKDLASNISPVLLLLHPSATSCSGGFPDTFFLGGGIGGMGALPGKEALPKPVHPISSAAFLSRVFHGQLFLAWVFSPYPPPPAPNIQPPCNCNVLNVQNGIFTSFAVMLIKENAAPLSFLKPACLEYS